MAYSILLLTPLQVQNPKRWSGAMILLFDLRTILAKMRQNDTESKQLPNKATDYDFFSATVYLLGLYI
jgi:hypothetical protein